MMTIYTKSGSRYSLDRASMTVTLADPARSMPLVEWPAPKVGERVTLVVMMGGDKRKLVTSEVIGIV
jgi:hypothetical protein